MSESRDDTELFWVNPQRRGVLPIKGFHISRSLARHMRQTPYEVRFDTDFAGVMRGCADRDTTWINAEIFDLYQQLFERGDAHCVELWQGDELVGGVYGLSIGGAFFGESMFSHRLNASKIGLAYLTDRLAIGGYEVFDTQFITDHLASLGAEEIDRDVYLARLAQVVDLEADFNRAGAVPSAQDVLQRNTQTS